ncbi:MAG: Tn3 family transposase, partial [Rhodobacteraceae bacterium]
EPGVKFYTHVTDQFAPYATRAIAASAPEAPHVLDGLLQHRGRVPVREHHTDTGGFTDHVFALCALLGFRFAPRIRDLPEKRLYVFDNSPAAPTLAPMIARQVRVAQLRAHWPQIVQLAASIRSGHVAAAHAVSTLAATTRQSGLATALAEIGRIERTIFMLEWMLQPDLRHRVQMGLNKGEARNNLARAVFFNRRGQLHDRTHENQQHRAAGCNLVVAAIILWNTVYLARAVETLRLTGIDAPDDVLRHVWPLGWDHINLTGDYRWSADNPKSPDQLRPLRLDRLRLPAAA